MNDLNFKIVENPPPKFEEKYEDFIELYNHSEYTIYEIREKLDWTVNTYLKAREKALKEDKLKPRKRSLQKSGRKPRVASSPKYYQWKNNLGKYIIIKTFRREDGTYKSVYYGAYRNVEDCKKVVDELIACDWNKQELENIKVKLGLI